MLGRLTSIRPGRVIGDAAKDNAAYYVTVTLDIERILRSRPGAVPASGDLKLELVTFQEEVVGMMVDAFAPGGGLFFLTSKGLSAARAGEPQEVQAAEMPLLSTRRRGCRAPGDRRSGLYSTEPR